MHDFQLVSFNDYTVLIYCTCGWLGNTAVVTHTSRHNLVEGRNRWHEHAMKAPRAFDNQVGRPIKQLPF